MTFKDRFQSRLVVSTEFSYEGTPCIEFPHSIDRYGYGRIKVYGKVMKAHRVSFLLNGGILYDGMVLDHKCENRLCSNPRHLEQVTSQVNNYRRFHR